MDQLKYTPRCTHPGRCGALAFLAYVVLSWMAQNLAKVPNRNQAMEAKPITAGEAVRHIRVELHLNQSGLPLTQTDLYWRCHAVEKKLANRRGALSFGNVQHDQPRHKIRRIEINQKNLNSVDLLVLSLAFDLPSDFLARDFSSLNDLSAKFHAARAQPNHRPASTHAVGFRRVLPTDVIPESRSQLIGSLQSTLTNDHKKKSALIIIDGYPGVGTSYVIAKSWDAFGKDLFEQNAICVDCSDLSLDEIGVAVSTQFSGVPTDDGSGSLLDGLNRNSSNLVVLDNLRLESWSPTSASRGRKSPQIYPKELAEYIARLANGTQCTAIILGVEVDRQQPIDSTVFVERLDLDVEFQHYSLLPLTEDEGCEFLENLGVTDFERDRLKQISRSLQGLPVTLCVAAEDLRKMKPVDRERYLEIISQRIGPADSFAIFFRSHLSDLRARLVDEESHPHALLRLLAIMPGPIPKSHLEELLAERRIRRLTRMSVEEAIQGVSPFILDFGDQIDINSMVRGILRSEIQQFIGANEYDQFTSREELEWIHWKCAQLNWGIFSHGGDLNKPSILAIESFVYHMMAIYRLLPPDRHRRKHWGQITNSLEQRIHTFGAATDKDILTFCRLKVINPFLMSGGHPVTKIFGQYETKARILESFIADYDPKANQMHRLEAAGILKEIGYCWMHAGKLASASDATVKAATLFRGETGGHENAASAESSNRTKELWRMQCDAAIVNATLDTRKGRPAHMVVGGLEQHLDLATRILLLATPSEQRQLRTPAAAAERIAIKLKSRYAHILLCSGRIEESIQTFDEMSERIQGLYGRTINGEAARRYSQALILGRTNAADRIEKARLLIEQNIAEEEGYIRSGRPASTDIVPLLVMRSAIIRVSGDLERARHELENTLRHEYVWKSQCTYVAKAELEMEQLRLKIASDDLSRQWLERAKSLSDRLSSSHHVQHAQEAKLLAAEFADGTERASKLEHAERVLVTCGWRLRLQDIFELRNGGSAVKRFGV